MTRPPASPPEAPLPNAPVGEESIENALQRAAADGLPPAADSPGSLEAALEHAAATYQPPAPPSIDAALSKLAAQSGTAGLASAQPVVRAYSLREVAVVLATFAAAMLALDSEGLLTWARRMEVGTAQSVLYAALGPLHRCLDAVGLTAPRRALAVASDAAGRGLGAQEDPLFADAWDLVEVAPYLDAMAEVEPADVASPAPLDWEAPERAATVKTGTRTVLLLGDSLFAGNLAAAITTSFAKEEKFRVVSAYQTATGLSRPDVFDWGRVVGPLLARERPRYVICSFGANDAQPIRQGEQMLGFGEAGWDAVYRARVVAMMRTLAASGTEVLWLDLPPMRDERLTRKVRHLNRLFAAAAKQVPGVERLEVSMLFAGPDGEFATFVNHGGQGLSRMRMDDGIHYAPAGARALAKWVVDWVRERNRRPSRSKRRP
ncbi:MAG: DUF459 domain-containing protein [Deltaproteobacteria bacterium]|nr:DUF459 domain-containing protein [Deltaproteobacteria bacterium]